jgi:tRNA(fMet)-specific endonuclease VapC
VIPQFILDTNVVIALVNNTASLLGERIRSHPPGVIALSVIVAHELYYGAFISGRRAKNVEEIESLHFPVLSFDKEDARQAGEVRAALRWAGTPIGPFDLLIAGQALARNLTLVTNNVREFGRVPGLRVEDWLGGN